MSSRNRQPAIVLKGFTLLEVLVALTVLAISALAVINQTGQSLRQLQQLEQKTVALIIAENQLNTLRIAEHWPATGRNSQTLNVAELQWQISTEVSNTNEPWLRKIEVSVSASDKADESPLITLTGYRGRY
jgi:general secretion pathway protein I